MLGDTLCEMPEESTAPDLVELVRDFWSWAARSEWDRILAHFAPDAVWDMSHVGLGSYTGFEAMRRLWNDWVGSYNELEFEVNAHDSGSGIVVAEARQDARPAGSTGQVQAQQVFVYAWVDGVVERVTMYPDIDEARAAAARLAASRS